MCPFVHILSMEENLLGLQEMVFVLVKKKPQGGFSKTENVRIYHSHSKPASEEWLWKWKICANTNPGGNQNKSILRWHWSVVGGPSLGWAGATVETAASPPRPQCEATVITVLAASVSGRIMMSSLQYLSPHFYQKNGC